MARDETGTTTRARSATVDTVKAIAIVFVVFAHVTLGLNSSGLVPDHVIVWTMPFYLWYMPAFFVAAGLFLEPTLERDGPWRTIGRRALELGYPFLVWSLVFGLTQLLAAEYTNTGDLTWQEVLTGLLPWSPREHMWFLPALFVAIAVTALVYATRLRGWRWILLGLATVMFLVAPLLFPAYQSLAYTIWVAAAIVLMRTPARAWILGASRGVLDVLVAFGAVAAFAAAVVLLVGPGRAFYANPFTLFVGTALGLVAVIAIAKLLAASLAAVVTSRIGSWSLYIYLTHVPILAAVRIAMTRFLGIEEPVTITVVSILFCLVLGCLAGWASDRGWLTWLFHLPRGVVDRATRSRRPVPVDERGETSSAR